MHRQREQDSNLGDMDQDMPDCVGQPQEMHTAQQQWLLDMVENAVQAKMGPTMQQLSELRNQNTALLGRVEELENFKKEALAAFKAIEQAAADANANCTGVQSMTRAALANVDAQVKKITQKLKTTQTCAMRSNRQWNRHRSWANSSSKHSNRQRSPDSFRAS